MHPLLPTLLSAAALAFSAGAGTRPASLPPSAAPTILDEREADFLEDEPGSRVVAAIRARLVRTADGGVVLRLEALPAGPRVSPPVSAHGVAGTNRVSADEIRVLLEAGRLALLARGSAGERLGRLERGVEVPVLVRRFRADGGVEHEAVPAFALAGEIALAGPGRHDVELRVDGVVRLAARCRVGRADARILSLEGRAGHAHEVR
jgi:hypothetical protein